MHILFLTVSDANEHSGGVEAVCVRLMRRFLEDGHHVVHCFSHHVSDPFTIESPNFTQYCFGGRTVDCIENLACFVDIIHKESIDVVMNETWFVAYHQLCLRAKKQSSFQLVYCYHGDPFTPIISLIDDFQTVDYFYDNLFQRLYHKTLQILKFPFGVFLRYNHLRKKFRKYAAESDAIVFLSESYRKQMAKILPHYQNKFYSIPNPICPRTDCEREKKNQVVFVGRLVRQKRVDRLLRIWKRVENEVPDASLVIVGDGEERERLHRLQQKMNLQRCTFLGKKPSEEIMAESKVLALVSSYEGMGLVAMEAMSVGAVPIFYDSLRCLKEYIINGQTGLYVPSFSKMKFAKSIVLLLRDEEYYSDLRTNGIRAVSREVGLDVFSKWYSLYSSLLNNS